MKPVLKPVGVGARSFLDLRCQSKRVKTIFSISLSRQEVREMGLRLSIVGVLPA